MAVHYLEITIDQWNVGHFQSYLFEKHAELYGIKYVSPGGLVAERNLIAKYIGTKKKAGMYSKEVVKIFIDMCFHYYKPSVAYPGLSFWFMTTYMTRYLQQAELAHISRKVSDLQVETRTEVTWL